MTFTITAGASVLSAEQAANVAALRNLLVAANEGDEYHAHQMPARLYGDVATACRNYLTNLLGDKDIAEEVDQHLIDRYRVTVADVHEVVAYVLDQRVERLALDNGRCPSHPAFQIDYCPSCGTSVRIGA